jgi:hypothetical protein
MKFLNAKNMTVWSVLGGAMMPSMGWACACGCGVFDVGGSSMLPNGAGGMAYLQYDWQNQNHNWSGTSQAPAANNSDKDIKTDFIMIGAQYLFNRSWGVQIEMPHDYRTFRTDTGNGPSGITTLKWDAPGDLRVHALYTGFAADLSSGLDFGLKLPTGNFTENDANGDIDRDSEIGTGSTDLLLGGFHRGNLTANQKWDWFVQGELDVPVLTQDQYRPGIEFDADAGIDYKGFSLGRVRISPLAQAIFSARSSDTGAEASNPVASGYERLLLSPGIEFHIHPVVIYADAEIPVWQNFVGNQLAAAVLFKVSVSYHF